ncbi:hypothetical protein [Mycobacterium colombiense]|uniref:hypothetical protein n=1 Tax=Mycobacterium colombiense TaxID=339268 RepID=UPI0018C8B847|nr:hypothetical protein [Mycobacterium colombiense]
MRRRVQPVPPRDIVHPLWGPVRQPVLVGELAELGQLVQRRARRVVGVLDEQLAEFVVTPPTPSARAASNAVQIAA